MNRRDFLKKLALLTGLSLIDLEMRFLDITCGYCGSKNTSDDSNCSHCGGPLDDEITRRANVADDYREHTGHPYYIDDPRPSAWRKTNNLDVPLNSKDWL